MRTMAEHIQEAQTAAIKADEHTSPPLGVVMAQVSRGEAAPKPNLLSLISECGVDPKDTAAIAAIIGGSPALAAACLNDDANKKVVDYLEECCVGEKTDRKVKLIEGLNDLDKEARNDHKDKLIDAINSLDGRHLEEIDDLRHKRSLGNIVAELDPKKLAELAEVAPSTAPKKLTAVERLMQERARKEQEGERGGR